MGTLVTDNIFGLGNTNPIKGSLFFEGKSSYLSMASGEIISGTGFGTNDFTIEFWINQGVNASNYTILISLYASTPADRFQVAFQSSTIQVYTDTSTWRDTGYAPVSGQWEHIAFVRNYSGNTLKMYANGVEKWSVSNNHDYNEVYAVEIGSYGESSYGYFEGYISNLRVLNGTALYTTNNFTPPTEELTVVENTVLLCCQDSNNPLQEATGKTIKPYGNLMVPVDKPELVTNGDFSNKLVGWDDVSVGTGYARYDTSRKAAQVHRVDGSNSGRIAQGMGLEAGKVYDVRVRCHSDSNTGLQFRGYKSSDSSLSSTTYSRVLATYGTTVFHFRYTGESGYDGLWFLPIDNTSTNSYITNISVKEYDPRPGDNLILNGHGNSGKTNEWTDSNTSTFEINAGRIKLTRSGGVGNCSYQALTTVVGQQYTLRADIEKGSGSYADIRVYTDSGFGTMLAYIRSNANTQGLREITFTATTTTTHITFVIDTNGETAYYDNIVVTPVHNYNSSKNVPTFGALADDGVVFVGDTKFDTKRYMVPSTGNTEHRGRGRALIAGGTNGGGWGTKQNAISYIQIQSGGIAKDFGDLSSLRSKLASVSSSTRAVFGGGSEGASANDAVDTIEYVTIATTGNVTAFGDALESNRRPAGGVSNNTRGLFAGGYIAPLNKAEVDHITIATTGSVTDYGDLSVSGTPNQGSSNSTRGVWMGGGWGAQIEYVTIASTGSGADFGNVGNNRVNAAGASSSTRALLAGGGTAENAITYITIATLGNDTDFGDLTVGRRTQHGTSNGLRGIFCGGYTPDYNIIDYVDIATTGNAKDFGDLTTALREPDACSDSHGGIS